jgi:cellulose synthase/poly-beta-1,6-N-acetylglucosamine synthase-like glycosyltransferase
MLNTDPFGNPLSGCSEKKFLLEYVMNKSIGAFLLNISAALYLLVTGILGLSKTNLPASGGEIHNAVTELFGRRELSGIIIITLSICAVAAGILILVKLFSIEIPIIELLLFILMVAWLVFIILVDFIPLISGSRGVVDFLTGLGSHLIVLGVMAVATNRFGG